VTDRTQDPAQDPHLPVPQESPGKVGDGSTSVETMGVREGMFGVRGTGDTSGYGGLVKPTIFPGASRRPYGGWFDEVADAIEARLGATDLEGAIERVVIDRG
jgi:NADH-quinone oxidoreductase subunit C